MVKDTHVTLLKLAVDGFSLTFGQSQKELLYMIENKMYKLYKFDHVQKMAKKKNFFFKAGSKAIWAWPFGRTDDKCPTSAGKVGAVGKVSVIIPTSKIWFGSSEAFKKDKRAGRRGFREPKCKTSQKRGKKHAFP